MIPTFITNGVAIPVIRHHICGIVGYDAAKDGPCAPCEDNNRAAKQRASAHHNALRDNAVLRAENDQLRARVAALETEVATEQQSHSEIASMCFAAGVETGDGTSVSAVRNLTSRVAALEGDARRACRIAIEAALHEADRQSRAGVPPSAQSIDYAAIIDAAMTPTPTGATRDE